MSDPLIGEVERLRWAVLQLGGRLGNFGHALVEESSKPSDPSDVRWDCLCGYGGSPEKVRRHWATHLAEDLPASPAPDEPTLRDHPRTYSLVGMPRLFLVTDDESGIRIGYADKIGGPLVHVPAPPAAPPVLPSVDPDEVRRVIEGLFNTRYVLQVGGHDVECDGRDDGCTCGYTNAWADAADLLARLVSTSDGTER